ncbi:MAG: hypothetical protein KJO07_25690 [Deltaproteobacteria bacterium]|nr:hypothetical protein [Deltaproteobacteria bacterium]
MMRASSMWLLILATSLLACGGDDDIDSDTEARWAYLGFDAAVDRAINLGFDGFNAASSANIPTQSGVGAETGTMDVDGQVDQGASANKEMRLLVSLVEYRDGEVVDAETDARIDLTYDTADGEPLDLDISLRNIPDGTFTGTMVGTMLVTGTEIDGPDFDAVGDFDLALSGDIQDDGGGAILRTPGTLTITGTVTSGDGVYEVNTTL